MFPGPEPTEPTAHTPGGGRGRVSVLTSLFAALALTSALALALVATNGSVAAAADPAHRAAVDQHEDATIRRSVQTAAPAPAAVVPADVPTAPSAAATGHSTTPRQLLHLPAPDTGEPPGRAPPIAS